MNLRRSLKALSGASVLAAALALAPAAHADAPATGAGEVRSAAGWPQVYIWASDVNVRHDPADADCVFYPSRASCPTVVAKVSRLTVSAHCQRQGETIHDAGYSNKWWTLVETPAGKIGWVNNIYIKGGEKIAGVPDCNW
ncbi:peptidase M23 [Streptomyces coeruleoprunus]|uniref:Peptidase M23 n=1 Tax=Streptomyces coeruleoprunus TaxID=285563 RepID=A0ABV9X8F2_9ACTN